jgi:hypothetical protein
MKLEKIAPLAEIISSVAIVATLIYLSIQMQQTNSALLADSRQATMLADMTLITALISNPEALGNTQRPFAELTFAEQEQLGNVLAGVLRSREFAWLQYQNGILDEATMTSYMETPIRWIKEDEAFMYYWEYFSKTMNPEFRSYINSLLEKSE